MEQNQQNQKPPIYKRTWFLVVMCIFLPPVGAILLWVANRPKNKALRIVLTVFLALVFLVSIVPSSKKDKEEATNTASTTATTIEKAAEEDSASITDADTDKSEDAKISDKQEEESNDSSENDELADLKNELKDKYDVDEPSPFVTGDATGKWRIVKVTSPVPASDYAVEYAKAYMSDDPSEVHFIVNFTLNTTTQLGVLLDKLSVKTMEYVDKEEHDAKVIGSGMLLTEQHFDLTTGEEIKVEADESAGTVSDDELVNEVKKVIEGSIGSGEKITEVSFADKDILIKVDMSGADTSLLSVKDIAASRVSSITDEILELDESYYNTWETVTLDFGNVGKITCNKSMVKDEGFGKYFDVYPEF